MSEQPEPTEPSTPQPEAPENPWDMEAQTSAAEPATAPAGKPLTVLPSTLLVLLSQLITGVAAGVVLVAAVLVGVALVHGDAPWQLLVVLAAMVLPGISALGAAINRKMISAFGYQKRSFWQVLTAYLLGWLGSLLLSAGIFIISTLLIFLAGGSDNSTVHGILAVMAGLLSLVSLIGTLLIYGWLVTVEWSRGLSRTLGAAGLIGGFLLVLVLGLAVGSLIDSGVASVKNKLELNLNEDKLPGERGTLREQLKDQDLLDGFQELRKSQDDLEGSLDLGIQNGALSPEEAKQLRQELRQQQQELDQMLQGK